MVLRYLITGLFICLFGLSHGQSNRVYELNWKTDGPLLGGGVGVFVTGLIAKNSTTPLSASQIESLDRSQINKFDRFATNQSSNRAIRISDYCLYSSNVLPLSLIAVRPVRNDYLVFPVMLVESILLTSGWTNIAKGAAHRARPFVYKQSATAINKTKKGARHSFMSGHTSTVSTASFFTAKVLTDYYPDMKLKGLVWTAAATFPAAIGFLRVRAGKHFPTDVLAGYATGLLFGYLVPHLHKKKIKETPNLSIMF